MILPYYLILYLSNIAKSSPIYAIIGNPPYQVMDGGGNGAAAMPIYHKFVQTAIQVSPRFISLIIPARWYAGGRGLDEFREQILNSANIAYIKDFPNSKECFPSANISGGICFFRWDRVKKTSDCEFVNSINGQEYQQKRKLNAHESFVRYNAGVKIIEKVISKSPQRITEIVSQYMPFGIRSFERGSEKPQSNQDLHLHTSRGVGYVPRNMVTASFDYIDTYNVATGKAISGHLGETDANGQCKLLATTKVLSPGEITTESYLVMGMFSSKEEAVNLYRYITTKFARLLLMMGLSSMNITRERFLFIPLQDFTPNSDIDWNAGYPDIDKQLYDKYALDDTEISFIEQTISSWQE